MALTFPEWTKDPLGWQPIPEIHPSDFNWLGQYSMWLLIVLFVFIHWQLYRFTHRRIAKWVGNDMILDIPLPIWSHIILAKLSFVITGLIVWLLTILVS